MRNYKQGEPRAKRQERTANQIEINDSFTPQYEKSHTVPDEGVTDAYFAHPSQAHSHHLQSGGPDMDMAVWGFNEQARQLEQEDRNKDETE
jgi:hypothetical protein